MRHVVIGTAGHVDHGKTALVKALTGTDTDRFPEEKARGITIDIGFASLTLPDGTQASVVDVPGHEDFVRNMVAGATGVDVALLVVAADEGVMPQTVEHLAILEFLALRTGVVALTKSDLVEADWLDLVRSDVTSRLAGSGISWEPPVAVSAVSGLGLDRLRDALARAAARAARRAADDLFRLPVDRVFSVAGAGTVVTGTSWSGTVSVGDHVTVLPQAASARVRSVEVHGDRRDRAEPGRRTALALAGLERAQAERGSVVVADPSWRATTTVDAVLTVLPGAPRPVSQRTRVRFHLGTAEVMARVVPAEGNVPPGGSGLVRLRFDDPVVARWGDRAVIRSYSPVTTIGGAVIVDPWPAPRPRRPVPDARRAGADIPRRVQFFVEANGSDGIRAADLSVRAGLPRDQVPEVMDGLVNDRRSGVTRFDDLLVGSQILQAAELAVGRALERFHANHPLEPGMPLELVRKAVGAETVAGHVLERLSAGAVIAVEGGTARLATHRAALDPKQEAAGRVLHDLMVTAGVEGRTVDANERPLAEFLVRQGTAVRVGVDRYYDSRVLETVVRKTLGEVKHRGTATPAQLRDVLGLSRKYLLPLLEWMDGRGWTARKGEGRVLTPSGERFLSVA